jgi:hypothetical protein
MCLLLLVIEASRSLGCESVLRYHGLILNCSLILRRRIGEFCEFAKEFGVVSAVPYMNEPLQLFYTFQVSLFA